MKTVLRFGVLLLVVASGTPAAAQGTATDEDELGDLFRFLDSEVRVASAAPRTLRTSPGIVTVVTRAEIIASGARDLMDVLEMVPGLHFGVDVQGAVGLGVRGNWGHEGKVLLVIDGHELNELSYSTTQFGNHYAVDNIEKIEIIRGPGSAIYGGFAELAVISITTRSGAARKGATASATYGRFDTATGRANIEVGAGDRLLDGELDVSMSAIIGTGARSDSTYQDIYQSEPAFSLADNAETKPGQVHLGASYRGLEARVFYDDYRVSYRDAFDVQLPAKAPMRFSALHAKLGYRWVVAEGVAITSQLRYLWQRPWRTRHLGGYATLDCATDDDLCDLLTVLYNDLIDQRLSGGVTAELDLISSLSLHVGLEAYAERHAWQDRERFAREAPMKELFDPVSYTNLAAFAQGLYDTPIASFTLGARMDHHSVSGTSIVPRFAATSVIGDFHVKGLASRAFRAPGVQNIELYRDRATGTIKPELTTVFELELGYRLSSHLFAVANAFDITIDRPIVYFFSEAAEGYANYDQAGSYGIEAGLTARYPRLKANLSYSYYHAGKNKVENYAVPGRDDVSLAFPSDKVAMSVTVEPVDDLSITPSAVLSSARHGFTSTTGGDDYELVHKALEGQRLVNLFVSYSGLFPGLRIGAGGFNLLGQDYRLLQPYDTGHAPYPAFTREFVLRVGYEHAL